MKDAQADMRQAYLSGGPGVVVSGIVWLATGIIATFVTQQMTILIFFIAGMFIYPLGIVLSKLLKRSGKHDKENPLGN